MSQSDDLTKLFDRFGGRQDTYREIVREDAAKEARERWPLLAAMRADQSMPTPPVQAASLTSGIQQPATDSTMVTHPAAHSTTHPAVPAVETPHSAAAATPAAADAEPAASLWRPASAPAAPVQTPAPATPPHAAAPAAQPLWQPAAAVPPLDTQTQPRAASPVRPASGDLQSVFARLEGRAEAPAQTERAPVRRSFLDRLNRS
ncbi:cellulose biosynthesis protein BcsP [Cupriavidus plantarum]|uniref:cellulose biosynthesis protein BcsP n=1 Tax=Cupriavidus plantarum TaxID=942865 RepID=UPI0015CB0F84|nr:cellulose biosynthesis protein BcsP [Cupriavidus plantarum]NYH99619.1 hypothetical protein [Cupriavidus plantarum]